MIRRLWTTLPGDLFHARTKDDKLTANYHQDRLLNVCAGAFGRLQHLHEVYGRSSYATPNHHSELVVTRSRQFITPSADATVFDRQLLQNAEAACRSVSCPSAIVMISAPRIAATKAEESPLAVYSQQHHVSCPAVRRSQSQVPGYR